ncbi:hypothetical protein KUM39_07810 [Streptomyces sp. J2-1]|uniref:hypothetical protein n=1 Tax=Streptomyces corallincola TaxID=2851888 RepID=UPI001C38CF75|nr:hypothetical protein [Streptomyces corallincola]MBV2354268.1 hypothetical protein [Streptomyces corallincola]
MSTYNFHGNSGPAGMGDFGRVAFDPYRPASEGLVGLSDDLLDALHAEFPGLVVHGEAIRGALLESLGDGGPPNRGRIRSALEAISIGAPAGTQSLVHTQQLATVLQL